MVCDLSPCPWHAPSVPDRRFFASDSARCECGFLFESAYQLSGGLFSDWPVVMTEDFARGGPIANGHYFGRDRITGHACGGRIIFESPYRVQFRVVDGHGAWFRESDNRAITWAMDPTSPILGAA